MAAVDFDEFVVARSTSLRGRPTSSPTTTPLEGVGGGGGAIDLLTIALMLLSGVGSVVGTAL